MKLLILLNPSARSVMFSCFLVLVIMPDVSFAQVGTDAVVGIWLNEEKEAKIEIYREKEEYQGKIVWLKEPLKNGNPKVDEKNPDEAKRDQPIIGLVMMKGFRFEDGSWEGGSIYDARNGSTYNCSMELQDANTLKIRGYIGYKWMGLGRTNIWTREKK